MPRIAAFVGAAFFVNSSLAGPQGSWHCTGKHKIVKSIEGISKSSTSTFFSNITFTADGEYIYNNPALPFLQTGNYEVQGRNVKALQNLDDSVRVTEYICWTDGVTCKLVSTVEKLKFKLNKRDSLMWLKGSIKQTVFFPEYGLYGHSKSTATGRCKRL